MRFPPPEKAPAWFSACGPEDFSGAHPRQPALAPLASPLPARVSASCMKPETGLQADTSLPSPAGPLLDDSVELFIELAHCFPLFRSHGPDLCDRVFVGPFLIEFAP